MRPALHAALVLCLAACASGPPCRSGYLGDYSDLTQGAEDRDLWEWRHPGADFSVYDRLVIEPVLIRLAERSSARALGDDRLRQVAEELHAAVARGAAPRWTAAPRGGPRTLRLQMVLVDLQPDSVLYEAEVIDTITASRLVKQVRRVAWPRASLAPF